MTESILICGGGDFLFNHLIAYLQNFDDPLCSHIGLLHTTPFVKFLDCPDKIPVEYYEYDLCDDCEELDNIFAKSTTVFYCAGKRYEYLQEDKTVHKQYWRENFLACECLIKKMVKNKVKRLIYVGDAYANLPNSDNYGLSEQMHLGIPKSYILGVYGESKTKGEMVAREAVKNGTINGLFLRPTIVYGEGEKTLMGALIKNCKVSKGFLNVTGDDRGNHQYIYAGNLAAIICKAMECLKQNPEKYNGEIMYCMDTTFFKPFMEVFGMEQCTEVKYMWAFGWWVYYQLLYNFGLLRNKSMLSLTALRFLYGWTVGFPDRKLRLLLDFVPPWKQTEAVQKTLRWYQKNQNFLEKL